MTPVFWPSTLVDTACANSERLAAINGGGTIDANAASYPAAAQGACAAAPPPSTDGGTPAAIDAEAGPSHSSPASCVTTFSYPRAAAFSSAASEFQAEAAVTNGVEPAPAYRRAELTSGGNAPKSIAMS